MDIWFRCGHCGKSLVADERGRGYAVNCPDCGTAMIIPDASTESPGSEDASIQPPATGAGQPEKPKLQLKRKPEPPRTKPCPYCAEEIGATAVRCPHCGTALDGPPDAPYAPPDPVTMRNGVRHPRYDQIPWHRREGTLNVFSGLGFASLVLIGGPIIAFLLLLFPAVVSLSGEVYRKKVGQDGALLKWGRNHRWGPILLCLIALVLSMFHVWSVVSEDKPVGDAGQASGSRPTAEAGQTTGDAKQPPGTNPYTGADSREPPGDSPSQWPSVTAGSCQLEYDDHYTSIFAGKVAAYINQIWTNWYVPSEWTNGIYCALSYEDDAHVILLPATPDTAGDEGLQTQLAHDNGEIAEMLFGDQVVRLRLVGTNMAGEPEVRFEADTGFYSFVWADNGSLVYRHPVTRAQASALVSLMTPSYYNGEQHRMMGLSFIDGRYFVEIEVGSGFLDAPNARDRMQDLVSQMASRVLKGQETRLDLVRNLGAKDNPLGTFYGGGNP